MTTYSSLKKRSVLLKTISDLLEKMGPSSAWALKTKLQLVGVFWLLLLKASMILVTIPSTLAFTKIVAVVSSIVAAPLEIRPSVKQETIKLQCNVLSILQNERTSKCIYDIKLVLPLEKK